MTSPISKLRLLAIALMVATPLFCNAQVPISLNWTASMCC